MMNESVKIKTESQTEISNDVTYGEGYHFYFEVDGHHIHAYGSAKSGKEKVFVDDELVAEKRSFSFKSCLSFTLDENLYEVEFNMAKVFTGELHCTLIKNGTHVRTQKKALKSYFHLTKKRFLVWLPLCVLLGFVFGYFFSTEIIQLIDNN
jgi:hypothetical protein